MLLSTRIEKNMYGTPEGTFLYQYLPEKKSKQNKLEGNQNNNITFKPLLIFHFQYIAEKNWNKKTGKEIKQKYLVLST